MTLLNIRERHKIYACPISCSINTWMSHSTNLAASNSYYIDLSLISRRFPYMFAFILSPLIKGFIMRKLLLMTTLFASVSASAYTLEENRTDCDKGVDVGCYNLGIRYDHGKGVEEDKAQGFKWYMKAAELGHVSAQYNLGGSYFDGEGVEQDKTEGVKWFAKAAAQGHVNAQFNLALAYDKGNGIEQDKILAVKWYTKAAEQGSTSAQYNLASSYSNGEGVKQDDVQAVKWYTKAANQGFSAAQYSLARAYYQGEGVTSDKTRAIELFKKSAANGDALAISVLKQLGLM